MKYPKQAAALALSAVMLCASALPTVAAAAQSSKKEEVIYIMTDAAGRVESINAVNIFGSGSVVDYGDYTDVKMLTTTDEISQNGDEITFTTSADRVYYQGTMAADTQIPWDISIRYSINGREISPAELSGQSGKLEIHFTVTQNESCEGTFYDDYALQASFTLDTEKCSNISAPDATAANVGKDKQLTYTLLPGRGIDTVITADVTDFSMEAVTINGVRMSLNIDIDDSAIKEKINEIVDAVNEADSGARQLDDGASQLHTATGTLEEKTTELHDGVGQIKDGADQLSDGLATLSSNNDALNSGAYQAFEGLCTAAQTVLNSQLSAAGIDEVTLTPENYGEVLDGVKAELNAMLEENCIKKILSALMAEKIQSAVTQIDDLHTQLDSYQTFCDGLATYTAGVSASAEGAAALDSAVGTLHNGTSDMKDATAQLNAGAGTLADGTAQLRSGMSEFSVQAGGADAMVDEQIDSIVSSLTGGDEVVSFVSEKNTDVDSVQFVIKTAAIEQAEAEPEPEEEAAPLTFWQKLLRLFGIGG